MAIKQTLDLNMKMFKIESDDSSIWGVVYFDECEITEDMVKLYDKVKTVSDHGQPTTTLLFIGGFAKENVEIIGEGDC